MVSEVYHYTKHKKATVAAVASFCYLQTRFAGLGRAFIYQQLVASQSGGIHAEAAPDIASSEARVTIIRTNLRICKAPYSIGLDSQNLSPGQVGTKSL